MSISLIRLFFCLIFVIPGNLMIFPLSTYISFYTERERIKALKGSTVKVKANDVRSSIKILAYICLYPFYLSLFTFIFNRIMRWYFHQDKALAYFYSSLFFFFFPIIQMISIRSQDGVRTHFTEFHGRFVSLFYTDQVQFIKSTRKVLKKRVRDVVDKVGPKIFKNFNKLR